MISDADLKKTLSNNTKPNKVRKKIAIYQGSDLKLLNIPSLSVSNKKAHNSLSVGLPDQIVYNTTRKNPNSSTLTFLTR